MWIVARYLPVAPFSLKSAAATASGGKTLLVPTPYAIKMALLDAAIRIAGIAEGERLFPFLRDLSVHVELPGYMVVFKSFSKIRRLAESKDAKKKEETVEEFKARQLEKIAEKMEQGKYPLYPTIAYREYVYYRDAFRLAFTLPNGEPPAALHHLLQGVNYLGKRGGFIQIMGPPEQVEQLPPGRFIELTPDDLRTFNSKGTLQMLDDCGKSLTFQRANIYSAERITLGKERILRHVVLPYRLKRSSRGYSWYEYIGEET